MKNGMRLAASLSLPFPGELRKKFISMVGICPSFSRQCQGIEGLGRALHGLSCEDDFSELGPSMDENGAEQLRLATEKPERRMKVSPTPQGKLSRLLLFEDDFSELGSPLNENGAKLLRLATEKPERRMAGKKKPNPVPQGKLSDPLMENVLGTRKSSQPSNIRVQDKRDIPSLAVTQNQTIDQDKSKTRQTLDNSCCVSVQNVPSTFTLADLVLAMSVFGKVSSARIRTASDNLHCDVEFEDLESSRRAAFAGEVTIENIHLPIRSSNSSYFVVGVRIEGIHTETTDIAVHTMCRSVGSLVGLELDGKDAVNAFYRVQDGTLLQTIVKRLSQYVVNDQCWSVKELPCKPASPAVPQADDGGRELGSHFIKLVNSNQKKWENQLAMKRIQLEDLQLLHQGIKHLQGQ